MTSEGNVDNKIDVSDSLSCSQCKKSLDPFNYFSLRKYEDSDDIDDDDILLESYNFCSTECSKKFLQGLDSPEGFDFFEMSRCVGYYDCKRLDNLRRMCESKELKSLSNAPDFMLSSLVRPPVCSPAEVGIIKSNIRLLDLFEKFDEVSTNISKEMLDHTKQMKYLTWILLFISVLNLILLIYQIFGSIILGAITGAK
jgi:hypothetical protein